MIMALSVKAPRFKMISLQHFASKKQEPCCTSTTSSAKSGFSCLSITFAGSKEHLAELKTHDCLKTREPRWGSPGFLPKATTKGHFQDLKPPISGVTKSKLYQIVPSGSTCWRQGTLYNGGNG